MVIVTGAFVAQRAQEQIGGEGTLLIEKAGLPRAQIGADGNTEVLALVVVVQRELEETEEGQQLIVDLRYPWGGTRMLDSGTTVSATAKWLGHDPAMTLRGYGHVYDDALASAGDVLLGGGSHMGGPQL